MQRDKLASEQLNSFDHDLENMARLIVLLKRSNRSGRTVILLADSLRIRVDATSGVQFVVAENSTWPPSSSRSSSAATWPRVRNTSGRTQRTTSISRRCGATLCDSSAASGGASGSTNRRPPPLGASTRSTTSAASDSVRAAASSTFFGWPTA